MQFKARILTFNVPLPPAGGEIRRAYLTDEGRRRLHAASRLFGAALREAASDRVEGLAALPPAFAETSRKLTDTVEHREFLLKRYRTFKEASGLNSGSRKRVEDLARKALRGSVDALNFLEDGPYFETAHSLLHETGAFVSGLFSCQVHRDEQGDYWDVCPVNIAHRRWGFSIGMSHDVLCSICSESIDVCRHLPGHYYAVTISRNEDDRCTGCGRMECDHQVGSVAVVMAGPVVANGHVREVTLTPRPRDPLARLSHVSLDINDLTEHLGDNPQGRDLRCTKCLEPCTGFAEFTPPPSQSA